MIERFFAPALTFSVLIAGLVAIATSLFGGATAQPVEQVVKAPALQLETVVITARRST